MIYVHIPFCVRKCNYCAFNSKVSNAEEISNYVSALISEIKTKPYSLTSDISSIYFGGGTPTVLKINQLEKILENLRIDNAAEITVEANPGTVDENYLRNLRELGFNRLSLGVQSFNDELLKILGRIHDSKTALETIQTAKKFFDNVSIDLMYGLPSQKLSDVQKSVEIAVAQDIRHISIYGLEIEEGTNFEKLYAAGKLNLPDDGAMYDYIVEALPGAGFRRYEISNFAKKNFESRHNLGYWTGKKYLGYGAGAHSYDGKTRTSNICDVATYIKKIRNGESVSLLEEIVSQKAAMEEFCFLGLRTAEGLSVKNFSAKFGRDIFEVYGKVIEKNLNLKLLNYSEGRIFLTPHGMKFGNIVFADFLL